MNNPKKKKNLQSSSDDEECDEITNPQQKRKLASVNTSGYTGVYKTASKKFQAQIKVNHKTISLGTYDSPKQAALAFDRAAIQHKRPKSSLNYPNGFPIDDEDYEKIMNPEKRRKLSSTNTTGYTGVYTARGNRFRAQIKINRKDKALGTYNTAKEAALVYDRAVIQHKLPFHTLNFPNYYTTSSEDDIRGDDESDDGKNDDNKDAVEPLPPPPARPHFERDPMLDRLFAEEQNKKQQQEE